MGDTKKQPQLAYRSPIVLPARHEKTTYTVVEVEALNGKGSSLPLRLTHCTLSGVGRGAFGVVFRGRVLAPKPEVVTLKRVRQDSRYIYRELEVLRRISHCNVVQLKYYFYMCEKVACAGAEVKYLYLVLEYLPSSLHCLLSQKTREGKRLSLFEVKLYAYQLLRALAYIHSLGICHRDIKPENLLLDESRGTLKVCDFSSAKCLRAREPNLPYVCALYYRAPELLFGSTSYTSAIDIWAAGCILAELVLSVPLFQSSTTSGQIVQIIEVLGTPTVEDIAQMNPSYGKFNFPPVKPHPWHHIFQRHCRVVAQLTRAMLVYAPLGRMKPFDALAHKFFNELRDRGKTLPNGKTLPPLFNFSLQELSIKPALNVVLVPPHAQEAAACVHFHSAAYRAGARTGWR